MKNKLPLLLAALLVFVVPVVAQADDEDNLILNGNFATGDLTNWSTFIADFAGASASISVADSAARIENISASGSDAWHIQLNQVFTEDQIDDLAIGGTYVATFDVDADAARPLTIYFGQDGGSFTALFNEEFTLQQGSQTIEFVVTVTQTFGDMKLGFEMGRSTVPLSITNVSMIRDDSRAPADDDDSDALFQNITVSSGKNFTLGKVEIGANNFIDRQFTITSIPEGFNLYQATMLRGSNDDRDINIETGYITFTVQEDVTIYVAYDNRRIDTAPAWLADNWTREDVVIGTSDVPHRIYSRQYTAGSTVDIGGPSAPPQTVRPNGIFVMANDGGELPTETEPAENVMEQDFILFANGRNVTIPSIANGTVLPDPVDGEDTVLEFNYGNWNIGGFNWGEAAINMQDRFQEGDQIHMRIWSSPNNSSASRLDNGNNTAKIIFQDGSTLNSLLFRAQLALPDEVHVGEWMDITIPLPKYATRAELDSAKVGRNVDGSPRTGGALTGYDALWEYWGTYSPSRDAVIDDIEDPDWREFNWNRVRTFGIYWDQAQAPNAPIYINNVYIGQPDADLSVALSPPPPITGVNASFDGLHNSVSFTPRDDVGGYNVYFSGSPITDVNDESVFLWTTIPRTATDFSMSHRVVSPVPADPEHDYYYAVAPTNLWGLANDDVSSSTDMVRAQGERGAFIFQLEAAEEDQILTNLETGVISLDGWPVDQFQPFRVNAERSLHPRVPPSDDVLSAEVYTAYGTSEGELIFYVHASVIDNDMVFNPAVVGDAGALTFDWNSYKRDQVEIRIGGYEVDYVSGPTSRAIQPGGDFLVNLRPYVEVDGFDGVGPAALGEVDGVAATYAGQANFPFSFPPVFQYKLDENDNRIGYEVMFAFTYNELRGVTPDSEIPAFVAPDRGEFMYIPFTVSVVDDRDDGRPVSWEQAAYQLFYSWKPNFGPMFFATPSDLSAAAIVGRDVPVSVDRELGQDAPLELALRQNFPNPFNPTTTISFQLPQADNVSLTVYNALGQRVATLMSNQQMPSGSHQVQFDGSRLSSGVYLYRLETGGTQIVRKMLLLK